MNGKTHEQIITEAIINDPVIAGLSNRKLRMMQSSGIAFKYDMITGKYFKFYNPQLQTLINQIDQLIEDRKDQIIRLYENN